MSRFLYSAKIAPVGVPFRIRERGEGARTVMLREGAIAAKNPKVRVDHEIGLDVGLFGAVITHRGWVIGDFTIDPDLVDEETEQMIRVGTSVSPGIAIFASRVNQATGIEEIERAVLGEVSLVRKGMIDGAKIVSRSALRAPRPQVRAAVRTAPTLTSSEKVVYDTLLRTDWPKRELDRLIAEGHRPGSWRVVRDRQSGLTLEVR